MGRCIVGKCLVEGCTQEVRRYPGKQLCDKCYRRQRLAKNPKHNAELHRIRNERYLAKYPTVRQESRWKTRYGITAAAWHALEQRQAGKCAICLQRPSHTLYVDHDHVTGKGRGLLCRQCNSLLGFAGEKAFVLHRAIAYLKLHGVDDGTYATTRWADL